VGTKTVKVPGLTIRLAYDVYDPAQSDGAGGAAENAFFTTTRTYADIPVVDMEEGALAGTLQVTIPRTGKASAKLVCELGTISFSAKSFAGMVDDGVFVLSLASTVKAYRNAEILVKADAEGNLDIRANGLSRVYRAVAEVPKWSSRYTAKAYQGQYTIAMPVRTYENHEPDVIEGIEGLAPLGTPHLTLKMTSASQWNAGKMTWAGMLANGTAISGTAVLTEGQGATLAYLPIVKQSSKDFFSALPQIQPGAKEQAESEHTEECFQTIRKPVLALENGEGEMVEVTVGPYWSHSEGSSAVPNAYFTVYYDLYGAIFDLAHGLDCCCQEFVGTTNLQLTVAMPLTWPYYGALGPVQAPEVTVSATKITVPRDKTKNPQGLTLSVSSTGVVSGSFKLPYTDAAGKAKTLSATYKGVVLIGWSSACGCGTAKEPFIQGAWYFTDKYGYEAKSGSKTVTRYLDVKRGSVLETVVPQ